MTETSSILAESKDNKGQKNAIILDEEQVRAVESNADVCMIIAGAGTGKTTTLVAKVKYLVEKKNVSPRRILLLSFSKKAVKELKNRISDKNGLGLNCDIRTFHSLGLRLWNEYRYQVAGEAEDIEFTEDSCSIGQISKKIIYDFFENSNKKYRLYNDAKDKDLKEKKEEYRYVNRNRLIRRIRNFISLFEIKVSKDRLTAFDKMISIAKNNSDEDKKEFLMMNKDFYVFFENYKIENKQISYGDMITRALDILDNKNSLEYDYIFVDEYQDISKVRYDFVKKLKEKSGAKLTVVGDDWQSIYGFSGSDLRLFTRFNKLMGGNVEEITLKNTYRNSQELLDIAGKFIKENNEQFEKNLVSPKSIDRPIYFIEYEWKRKIDVEKDGVIQAFMNLDGIVIQGPDKPMPLLDIIKIIVDKRKLENRDINGSIMLLGRYGNDINKVKECVTKDKEASREKETDVYRLINCEEYKDIEIYFYTVHKAKGLEAEDVILLNPHSKTNSKYYYGFPCQISRETELDYIDIVSDDEYFSEPNESELNIDEQLEEERRLFYVALTRTKNRVYIALEKRNRNKDESVFVKNIKSIIEEELKQELEIIPVVKEID